MRLPAQVEIRLSELATGKSYHVRDEVSAFVHECVCSAAGSIHVSTGDLGGDEATLMGHLQYDRLVV